ncbi:hypothetical protein BGP77_17665 [Saccharospirillum sp. MSK14-1]|nr:hypothetical protein BGP77_17665 [Saccharospirillum sp. MSK14-1]
MLSLNLTPTALPGASKSGSSAATQFPQSLALVQAVPTSQVTPVTQVPRVTTATREEAVPSQEAISKPNLERDPVEEFKKYMALSPAEKMRHAVLDESELSIDDYQSLPPEEKQKIDTQVVDRLSAAREAQGNSHPSPKAIAHYYMEMQRDLAGAGRVSSTSIFV